MQIVESRLATHAKKRTSKFEPHSISSCAISTQVNHNDTFPEEGRGSWIHSMGNVLTSTTMKLVIGLLLLFWSSLSFCKPDNELVMTAPVDGLSEAGSSTRCFDNVNIDVTFLNESTNELIRLYDTPKEDGEDACALDTMLDRLLPDTGDNLAFDLSNASRTESLGETIEIFQSLLARTNQNNNFLAPFLQKLTPRLAPLIYQIQASPECMSAIVHLMGAIRRNEIWALKFIDSSAKLPSGLLDGQLSVVGDYEQCLNAAHSQGEGAHFTGKHCFMKPIIPHPDKTSFTATNVNTSGSIQIPPALADDIVDFLDLFKGSFVRFGVCLPSVCDASEIETSINSILYPLLRIPIQVGPDCQTYKNETLQDLYSSSDRYQKLAFWIFAGLFVLGIFSSIIDAFARCPSSPCETLPQKTDQNCNSVETESPAKQNLSLWMKILLSFSILNNTREMFKIDNKTRFASVDFIRFMMLIEVIIMHQYYVALGWSAWPVSSRLFAEQGLTQSVSSAGRYAFLRNIHNTDFFFALTGMLMTYSTFGAMDRRKGSFNYVWYMISMYLRFYPAVFGVILMYYLLPLVGSGPFWSLLDEYHVETCRKNLLPNVLSYNFYLLNLEEFARHSMCNIASWWVTSCFHLIILAPIVFLPMYYYRSMGFTWAVFVMIAGSVASVAHMIIEKVPFMNQVGAMSSILENSFYSIFYTWPFIHHIGPFVAGMLVGYLIRRAPKLWLGARFGQMILTIIFIGFTIFSFSWTEKMLRGGIDFGDLITGPKEPSLESQLEVYLNVTVGKLMFVSGFLWLFYLCCTNRAQWVNKNLFSWPWLKPLYSLSMGLYLTNFIPPLYFTFSTRQMIEFNDMYVFKTLPTNLALTIMLAYILHVLFERPVMNILKIVES